MKKILPFFMLVSSFCFGYTDSLPMNMETVGLLQRNGNPKAAICYLGQLIHAKDCENVDKVHYLVCRSTINLKDNDPIAYSADIGYLKYLCKKYPECLDELWTFYEMNLQDIDNLLTD